jgi:Mn2+/Fe2+ NRAMP family transporter
LWTALVTYPLMAGVQFICAKVGMVSGQGLASLLQRHYGRRLSYGAVGLLVAANTINAGVDLGAIAAGINLLVPVPVEVAVVPVTVLLLALQIWGSYRLIAGTFKWLTLALFAYLGAAFFARPNGWELLRGTLIPNVRWDAEFLTTLVAILGTTISPYLFFWQTCQEVEEERAQGRTRLRQRRGATDDELRAAAWDVNVGMFFSNLVMYFIILTTAATLYDAGRSDIATAADAAEALRPLAGDAAGILLALGLIGTGFLAVPILTGSAAYALAGAACWKRGLDSKLRQAPRFYGVIVVSTLIGMLLNFVGLDPVKALFWTAVLNGVLAPPLLVVVMLVANNRAIMGKWVNSPGLNILGWATTLLMLAAAVGLAASWPW